MILRSKLKVPIQRKTCKFPLEINVQSILILNLFCHYSSSWFEIDGTQYSELFIPILSFFLPALMEGRKQKGLKKLKIENHGLNFDITVDSLPAGVTQVHGSSYSTAGLMFRFRRNKVSTLITGYYLPSGIYSLLAGLSFSIPKEQVTS